MSLESYLLVCQFPNKIVSEVRLLSADIDCRLDSLAAAPKLLYGHLVAACDWLLGVGASCDEFFFVINNCKLLAEHIDLLWYEKYC